MYRTHFVEALRERRAEDEARRRFFTIQDLRAALRPRKEVVNWEKWLIDKAFKSDPDEHLSWIHHLSINS